MEMSLMKFTNSMKLNDDYVVRVLSSRNLNFKGLHIIIPQSFKRKTPNGLLLGIKISWLFLPKFQGSNLKPLAMDNLSTLKGHSLYQPSKKS